MTKAYVISTGALFGLLTVVHLLRIFQEGPHLASNPWFIVITIASASLCVWSWRVLRHSAARG